MKVSKLYAEFVVKFPKVGKVCCVSINYENKYFVVYVGKELTDEEYDSLITRFKVGDDFMRELRSAEKLS